MQLGKELATGFVADDVQAAPGQEANLPPDGADAKAPEASPSTAPDPEPAAAG
ncbi:MAG TPA: hypothetical protein VKD66_02735 [Streptosporangiaceae bacterium]|jgi:hypothetical protein|nr:hypothetical protein [Streptosporangiaceae bacterium]